VIRRCIASFVVFAFLANVGPCLNVDLTSDHFRTGSPSMPAHTAPACGTSAIARGGQFDSTAPLPSSLLAMEQNTTYEDIGLTPPSPPPRG
jgi:hypothetical protein